jgi:hypothetical protein
MPPPSRDEPIFRLADGLFPVRLEPGKTLLMGREGSPLLIELRSREKNGMDVLVVYDPSGAKPSPEAVAHALEPLSTLAGDPCDPPADAPPASCAFRWRDESSAVSASRAGLDPWLDGGRLEAMLWPGLEAARAEGKSDRDLIMAVFDGGNRPGFEILRGMLAENEVTRADAERRARSSVHAAESQGGRLVFQILDTPDALRRLLETNGLLGTHGERLDSALAAWPTQPEGYVRAMLFDDADVKPRLVPIRSPGERASEAAEDEKDAILQAMLDTVGEKLRDQFAERRKSGTAAHNLAILVEEHANGELKTLVAMRSQIAQAIGEWGGPRAKPIAKALEKSAPAGMTHAVLAVRRGPKTVLMNRLMVVQQGPRQS